MVLRNLFQVVEVVDHRPVRLGAAIFGSIRIGMHRMDQRTVTKVETSHRIKRHIVWSLGFQKLMRGQRLIVGIFHCIKRGFTQPFIEARDR